MSDKKDVKLAPVRVTRDPMSLLRQMTHELDRVFDEPFWPSFRLPSLRHAASVDGVAWAPKIDVFQKDQRLVTRIDLPGMKKEDVNVEVSDGQLTLSGERKRETEEKKDGVYRSEREYGTFYRSVPLPEGIKLEDVKATFADGVLEVSVPLPVVQPAPVRKVAIDDSGKPAA